MAMLRKAWRVMVTVSGRPLEPVMVTRAGWAHQAVHHGGQVGGRVVGPGADRGGLAASGHLVEGLLGMDRGLLPEGNVEQ